MSDDLYDARVNALALWLETEFDADVYDCATLATMRGEDWRRLARSALLFVDRAIARQAI